MIKNLIETHYPDVHRWPEMTARIVSHLAKTIIPGQAWLSEGGHAGGGVQGAGGSGYPGRWVLVHPVPGYLVLYATAGPNMA